MEKETLKILLYKTSKSIGNSQRNTIAQEERFSTENGPFLEHDFKMQSQFRFTNSQMLFSYPTGSTIKMKTHVLHFLWKFRWKSSQFKDF